MSEAQLLERCTRGVEACREALHDLRTHVKAARSNREKCSGLLAAATTAVYNLDELLYSHDLDLAKEKQLQHLCSRVQNAIDQASERAAGSARSAGLCGCVIACEAQQRPLLATDGCGCAAAIVPQQAHPCQQEDIRTELALASQAEAKAKVYGQMNGVTKFAARIFSDTDGKFEELRQELIELGKQVRWG